MRRQSTRSHIGNTPREGCEDRPSLIRSVVADLDDANVRWCLLRDDSQPPVGPGEIDILVADADIDRAADVMQARGFVRLRAYGRGTHRFFLGFEPNTRLWLEFDLVTEMAYGRHFEVRTEAEGACLARRQRHNGMWTLAPDDEFWALLLHCLLDKRGLGDHHLLRLMLLRRSASWSSPLARAMPVRMDLPPVDDEAAEAWVPLLKQRGRLLRAWGRAHPVVAARRVASSVVLRLLERPLQAWSRRGASVALLGPDGAGKSTLAAGIESAFYYPTRRVYMGLWPSREAPRGAAATTLRILLRPLVVWRRYLASVGHRARGRLVVFDRYVYDALLPPRGPLGWLKRPYFRMLSRLCPAPDLVVLLDVPGSVMHQRSREYDPDHLEAERTHYRALSRRIPGLLRVDASRPAEVVLGDVLRSIWQHYANRAGR